MTIGIIGSGAIGTAFARTLARAGIEATISNSRGPDSLRELVRELGPAIKAGTREEAALADIVFVAVNWTKLPAALAGLPEWSALKCSPRTRDRAAGVECCFTPATTAPRRQRWRRSSNKSASSELISDRSPSAASSRNFQVAHCQIKIS